MKTKKITIICLMLVVVLVLLLYIFRSLEDISYQSKGMKIIAQIEHYKREKGRLPNTLSDMQIEECMDEGPYYDKIDSVNYAVYFNIGFDDYFVYLSKTKKWKYDYTFLPTNLGGVSD